MGWSKTGRAVASLAALAALATVTTACGDDDDAATADGDDTEAFCEVALEIDAQEDFPSIDQLERYRDAAPDEIREEAELVAAAFIDATRAGDMFVAFEAEGVDEAFEVIEPYEEETCGIESDEDEGDEEPEQDASVTELDPAATRVDVIATDFAFAFTPPVAGRTSFVMSNEGVERHVMYLFRLSEGSTVDDVLASDGEEGYEEDWESDTATKGEEAVVTAELVAGEYGLICYIPAAEGGEPHYKLGMQNTFTVT